MKLRRRCDCCGNIFEVNKDIFWTVCPYREELGSIEEIGYKIWHCNECDYTCGMDI